MLHNEAIQKKGKHKKLKHNKQITHLRLRNKQLLQINSRN